MKSYILSEKKYTIPTDLFECKMIVLNHADNLYICATQIEGSGSIENAFYLLAEAIKLDKKEKATTIIDNALFGLNAIKNNASFLLQIFALLTLNNEIKGEFIDQNLLLQRVNELEPLVNHQFLQDEVVFFLKLLTNRFN
jgi:hypothetical protein